MPKFNPYSPPKSDLGDVRFMYGKMVRDTFAALVLLQLLLTLRYSGAYFELVSNGSAHPLGLMLTVAASFCLYLGTILFRFKGSSKVRLFLLAGIGLAAAVPIWRFSFSWSHPGLLGAALGAAGYWLARRRANGFDEAVTEMPVPIPPVSRPVAVYIIFILCCAPVGFLALFITENWPSLSAELLYRPMVMVTKFIPALLFMSGGFLLLFMRKEAIILFAMYLVFQFGRVISSFATPLAWLDFLLVLGVIAYSIHLLKKRVLH